jgi:type IV fimbrial biogenesis protein FimT
MTNDMFTLSAGLRIHPLKGERVHGFTLVELAVTMAIMAILAMIAIPAFNNISLGTKLNSISNAFVSSVQLARSEAIKRNQPVSLCASSNGTSCGSDWSAGWIVAVGGQVVQVQGAVSNGFQVSGAVSEIIFQPSGVGVMPAEISSSPLTVCRFSPDVGSQKREITISATGRPSVAKLSASSCP